MHPFKIDYSKALNRPALKDLKLKKLKKSTNKK